MFTKQFRTDFEQWLGQNANFEVCKSEANKLLNEVETQYGATGFAEYELGSAYTKSKNAENFGYCVAYIYDRREIETKRENEEYETIFDAIDDVDCLETVFYIGQNDFPELEKGQIAIARNRSFGGPDWEIL